MKKKTFCKDLLEVKSLTDLKTGEWMLMEEAVEYLDVGTADAIRAQIRKGRIDAKKLNKGLVINKRSLEIYRRMRENGDFRGGGRPRKD
jgi:hypothetical protein